jgi:putative phosphonate catabolism associated alcohol dehydrogenase
LSIVAIERILPFGSSSVGGVAAHPARSPADAVTASSRETNREGRTRPRYPADAARAPIVQFPVDPWTPGVRTVGDVRRRQGVRMTGTLSATRDASLRVTGSMEARVFRGAGVPFEAVAVPELDLAHGEVLAEVELATICGSDVLTVQGARPSPLPLVLGHEQVGRVVAVGPGRPPRTVDGSPVAVGQRIVWGVTVDCGRCRYCHAGLPQGCVSLRKYGHARLARGWELSGSFASHVQLRARTPIVAVGADAPAELLAPASCCTATVMAALDAARAIRPLVGAVVVISGCGMRGLTAVAAAVAEGALVVATDPDRERRAAALEFGAVAVGDGTAAGLAQALRRVPAGRSGYHIALELSGAPPAVPPLLGAADLGAVLVLVGSVASTATVAVDPEQVVRRLLTIRGVHDYAPDHLRQAVRFLERPESASLASLVGDIHPLDGIESAMLHARAHTSVRVGLKPDPRPVRVVTR